MKAKRIIALLMAICLFALAFVSCSKQETPGDETKPSNNTAENGDYIGIDKYSLIYADGVTYDVESAFSKLSAQLYKLIGIRKVIKSDSEVAADDSAYEILVGDTNRSQSAAAKAALTGQGYSITQDGNKIVIVATDNMILEDAINYFISNTKKVSDEKCEYPTNYISEPYQALDLVSGDKANYSVVFTDFYNNLNYHSGNYNADISRGENSYTVGYTQTKVKEFTEDLKKITGVSFNYYSEKGAPVTGNKIIIGKPNGDTIDYFDYHENGIYLKDGDIYIYGHNHEGIELAINNFIARVNKYHKVETTKFSILCQTQGYKFSNSDIKYDIPLPKDIKYEGAYTAANDGIYFVYENCSKDAFNTYCAELEAAGFTKYFNRDASTNSFAGFYKGEEAAWVYYITDRKEMRIVFEEYQPLPDFTKLSGAKVQDAYVTQMGVSYTSGKSQYGAGMGYIIGLEDGRYIVIDGGVSYEKDKTLLAKRYYDYMKDNNKHASGEIVIAAWIITHGHSDHYSNFDLFGKNYGSNVKCQYIIHNLPTELTLWGAANMATAYLDGNYRQMDSKFKNAVTYTVHTGYAANIGGVDIEFMSTYEDLYNNNDIVKYSIDSTDAPNAVDEFNDTSVTFRFAFDNGKGGKSTLIFLGDNYFAHGERLASMWESAYMKSDVVQMPHHGYANGVGNSHEQRWTGGDYISNAYKEIAAEYGLCSGPSGRITESGSVYVAMKSANSKFSSYNIYYNDYNGLAKNTKMTFNGKISAKLSTVV